MIYAAGVGLGLGAALLIWAHKRLSLPPPKLCGTPPVTSPRIRLSSGRHIAYRQLGVSRDEARFKVLIIHGFDSSKDLYIPLSQEFMESLGLCIIAIDRAGYGESDSNPYRTIKSETLDLQELADELHLGSKFYVMGLSMGNYISWGCLKYIPHRLAGLALVVPAANYWWPSFPVELSREALRRFQKKDQLMIQIAHHAPLLLDWWMSLNIFPKPSIIERDLSMLSQRDLETIQNISQIPNPDEYKV